MGAGLTSRKTVKTEPGDPGPQEWKSGTGKVLRVGDVVRVERERGRFVITKFATEAATGDVVEMVGGHNGRRNVRNFAVDRVTVDRRAMRERNER